MEQCPAKLIFNKETGEERYEFKTHDAHGQELQKARIIISDFRKTADDSRALIDWLWPKKKNHYPIFISPTSALPFATSEDRQKNLRESNLWEGAEPPVMPFRAVDENGEFLAHALFTCLSEHESQLLATRMGVNVYLYFDKQDLWIVPTGPLHEAGNRATLFKDFQATGEFARPVCAGYERWTIRKQNAEHGLLVAFGGGSEVVFGELGAVLFEQIRPFVANRNAVASAYDAVVQYPADGVHLRGDTTKLNPDEVLGYFRSVPASTAEVKAYCDGVSNVSRKVIREGVIMGIQRTTDPSANLASYCDNDPVGTGAMWSVRTSSLQTDPRRATAVFLRGIEILCDHRFQHGFVDVDAMLLTSLGEYFVDATWHISYTLVKEEERAMRLIRERWRYARNVYWGNIWSQRLCGVIGEKIWAELEELVRQPLCSWSEAGGIVVKRPTGHVIVTLSDNLLDSDPESTAWYPLQARREAVRELLRKADALLPIKDVLAGRIPWRTSGEDPGEW